MEQKIKSQKLSPMRYIRNNKRRVSVLVVSLSLCIAIIYVVNFLVMTADAMARNVFLDTRKLSCVIGFTLNFEDDEYLRIYLNFVNFAFDKYLIICQRKR